MKRAIRSFTGVDADGQQHAIIQSADLMDGPTGEDASNALEDYGASSFRTSDGREVVRVRRGEYVIKETGEVLRSTDPDAP